MERRDPENNDDGSCGDLTSNPIRCYLVSAAWILFIAFCLLELVIIPLFGVHANGIPVPRWQMRPGDLFLHLIHSVSPALVRPAEIVFLWGIGFGVYFGFRTISKKTVLGEPTRAKIFNTIREEPGIHFNALRHRCGINRGTLRYHLAVLSHTKKIHCIRDGIFSRYIPNGSEISSRDKIVACRFANGPDRAILSYLLTHPHVSQHEIGSAVGMSPSVMSWRLQRLWHEGIVIIDREGRTNYISITGETQDSIRKIQSAAVPVLLNGIDSQGSAGQKSDTDIQPV
ncbi:MAG: Helix-turn-helix domain protein [Methanoregula sp. PtaU1.Bin051]|nr:MAG: Helix-turn-helix domain protein [Methanoregula sp. PtaU1.Bin051]